MRRFCNFLHRPPTQFSFCPWPAGCIAQQPTWNVFVLQSSLLAILLCAFLSSSVPCTFIFRQASSSRISNNPLSHSAFPAGFPNFTPLFFSRSARSPSSSGQYHRPFRFPSLSSHPRTHPPTPNAAFDPRPGLIMSETAQK